MALSRRFPDQIRAKARRVADYLDLLYVHRIIAGHSAHPSELDIVICDLIPKLRDAADLEAVTGLLGAELSADLRDFAAGHRQPSGPSPLGVVGVALPVDHDTGLVTDDPRVVARCLARW